MTTPKETISTINLTKLNKFLRQNKKIDWQRMNFLSETQKNELNWKGLENDEEILKYVKAYQRIAKILGEDDTKLIKSLLKNKIHSAIQIAAIPKPKFITEYSKVFGDDKDKIEKVHQKATAIRSELLITYMNSLQNKEPHVANVATL